MELTYECPQCATVGRRADAERAEAASCDRCGAVRPLHPLAPGATGLDHCLWCGTEDLYLQKDFPHGLGLAIVVAGFAISTVFWALYRPVPAFGVLLLTAALDVVLYYLVPDVSICYRCLAQHRGPGTNPEGRVAPFDLAIGERYRQERLRAEELRAARARSGP